MNFPKAIRINATPEGTSTFRFDGRVVGHLIAGPHYYFDSPGVFGMDKLGNAVYVLAGVVQEVEEEIPGEFELPKPGDVVETRRGRKVLILRTNNAGHHRGLSLPIAGVCASLTGDGSYDTRVFYWAADGTYVEGERKSDLILKPKTRKVAKLVRVNPE